MSLFSNICDPAALAEDGRTQTAPAPKARQASGPVLMGDIHPAPGGRPLLLSLWERWEAEVRER